MVNARALKVGYDLACKVERFAKDKHSSLFYLFINDEEKMLCVKVRKYIFVTDSWLKGWSVLALVSLFVLV
jgi:hypothetical protein